MFLTRRTFLSQAAKAFAGGVVVASGVLAIAPSKSKAIWLATPEPRLTPGQAEVLGRDVAQGITEGVKSPGALFKPMRFYCPNCYLANGDTNRKSFIAHFMPGWGFGTVLCPDCNTQWCILRAGDTARVLEDPPPCDYGCENTGPYGFVPECGCPIHDPSG